MLPTFSPPSLRPPHRPCSKAMVQTNQNQRIRFTNHLDQNLIRRHQPFYETNFWRSSVARKLISVHGRDQARLERCSLAANDADPARIESALQDEALHQVMSRRDETSARICTPIVKTIKKRDKAHLRFVASHPCLVCRQMPCDAHHIKFSQPRSLGSKVSDEFTVPLCRKHHRPLHQHGNERAWWANVQVEPMGIAKELWLLSRQVAPPRVSSLLSRAGVAEKPHD